MVLHTNFPDVMKSCLENVKSKLIRKRPRLSGRTYVDIHIYLY